jgi:hypothetical protein
MEGPSDQRMVARQHRYTTVRLSTDTAAKLQPIQ